MFFYRKLHSLTPCHCTALIIAKYSLIVNEWHKIKQLTWNHIWYFQVSTWTPMKSVLEHLPRFFATIPDGNSGESASCCYWFTWQQLADSQESPSGIVAKSEGLVSMQYFATHSNCLLIMSGLQSSPTIRRAGSGPFDEWGNMDCFQLWRSWIRTGCLRGHLKTALLFSVFLHAQRLLKPLQGYGM